LQNQEKRVKLIVRNGYVICPVCRRNKRMHRVTEYADGKRIPAFCRDCKTEFELDMHEGQCFESRSQ
jgi:hypothetical protein